MRLIDADALNKRLDTDIRDYPLWAADKDKTAGEIAHFVSGIRTASVLASRQPTFNPIEDLRTIHALVWDYDIPSPTVPEYIEHHEQMQEIMKLIKEIRKKYEVD